MKTTKRLLTAALCAVIAISLITGSCAAYGEVFEYTPTVLRGDADGDGEVTASDARDILRAAITLDEPPAEGSDFFAVYDCTSDLVIAADDARQALRYSLGLDENTVDISETIALYRSVVGAVNEEYNRISYFTCDDIHFTITDMNDDLKALADSPEELMALFEMASDGEKMDGKMYSSLTQNVVATESTFSDSSKNILDSDVVSASCLGGATADILYDLGPEIVSEMPGGDSFSVAGYKDAVIDDCVQISVRLADEEFTELPTDCGMLRFSGLGGEDMFSEMFAEMSMLGDEASFNFLSGKATDMTSTIFVSRTTSRPVAMRLSYTFVIELELSMDLSGLLTLGLTSEISESHTDFTFFVGDDLYPDFIETALPEAA
ncbi:MAG: hypothetical protein K6C36_07370 [Clostridia bacterium]|nr:hypothetical protein [Clostridia bacterium]